MDIKSILHFVSHLKWIFLIAAIILIAYSLFMLPENLISIIGINIFLIGIHMGLDSLSDMEKMSEKSRNVYADGKNIKMINTIILSSVGITVIISILFLSLKFVFPSKSLFEEFFNLGLDCWALILGLLCLLKSNYDKHNFVNGTK